MITYRVLTEQADFFKVSKMEQLVWGVSDFDAISWTMMTVITHTGGCIHGAFADETLIGCSVALPMKNEPRLWSVLAAVHPDYQRQGIGYSIKQAQRDWAMAAGYMAMSWTFDPIMAANAHFNFHRLGVYAKTYHVDFYGEMKDALNIGVPSDRFEVIWPFDKPAKSDINVPDNASFLLTVADDKPVITDEASDDWHFVEIPADFSSLRQRDKALAIDWKNTLRDVAISALDAGYHVVDFVRQNGRNWYVLKKV